MDMDTMIGRKNAAGDPVNREQRVSGYTAMDMDTMIGRKNAAGDPVNTECRVSEYTAETLTN